MSDALNIHNRPKVIMSPQEEEERRKWECRPGLAGLWPLPKSQGGRVNEAGDFEFQEFPKMLYKAGRMQGRPAIVESRIVGDRDEEARAVDDGFRVGQDKALEALHAQDLEFAKLSANQNYHAQRMSAQAQAELEAFNAGRAIHQPNMPEQPIKRRGRPAKAAQETIDGV